ncbi:AraC family transcriptional regulator [Enterococcus cecorum]|uniref:AraC family transcriptional regulator n=1 Tax=Enterococcus cecorum TaxID=44008 RepID=UPI00195779F5|nr:AraC family transcriptional regulator [Enterococcus cecorum]MBM6935693.1 helix-turn-helix transcriptional regulator [Enterococcus cecorum]
MTSTIQRTRKIYTASSFAKENLLYLQEIGKLSTASKHESFRKTLDSFLLVYVSNGSGILQVRNQQYALNTGNIAVINCLDSYKLNADSQGWQIFWIHINGKMMKEIYKMILDIGKDNPIFQLNSLVEITKIWEEIYATTNSDTKIKELLINEQLFHLINQVLKVQSEFLQTTTSHKEKIQQVRNYLEENFSSQISLDQLAEIFYINKYYLTRIYKEIYQQTINQTLTQLRITKAKELLRYSELSMVEIAVSCGFQDASYFSKVFKKIEGESPQKYRTSW